MNSEVVKMIPGILMMVIILVSMRGGWFFRDLLKILRDVTVIREQRKLEEQRHRQRMEIAARTEDVVSLLATGDDKLARDFMQRLQESIAKQPAADTRVRVQPDKPAIEDDEATFPAPAGNSRSRAG